MRVELKLPGVPLHSYTLASATNMIGDIILVFSKIFAMIFKAFQVWIRTYLPVNPDFRLNDIVTNRLSDLTNKHAGDPVKSEFHVNDI